MIKVNKLKGARVEKGLTQIDMARQLKMSLPTYHMKENGKRQFTVEEMHKVAKILEKPIDYFF